LAGIFILIVLISIETITINKIKFIKKRKICEFS